ncbi:conserved protein, unknown function, partial [Plasmodium malariae]
DIEIIIDNGAYAKIFMHALKHSFNDVCGLLIGKYSEKEKKKQKCIITNTIPLFHTHILSPFLKLAFTLVENYYKGKEGRIIGYYHICVDDSKNGNIKNIKICNLISEKIIQNYSDAIICLAELSKLEHDEDNCVNMFIQDDKGEWEHINMIVSPENKDFLKRNISSNTYLNICDFDDHLNCIKYDFMNPNLFKDSK